MGFVRSAQSPSDAKSRVLVLAFVILLSQTAVLYSQTDGTKPSTSSASQASPKSDDSEAADLQDQLPDLSLPEAPSLESLDALIKRAKSFRPQNSGQYQAMQTAIRDASKQLLALIKEQKDSPRYRQAEMDMIASSVALMTYFGEDAKQKTLEQVHEFLKSRKSLSLQDVQTGMLAAAMLELQSNKKPARDTYSLLNELLAEDEREEMQSLRLNLDASVRRLDLLGSKFELQARAVDGTSIKIDDYAGKFVIVDFFATWCEPCLAEIPRLQKHYEKFRDKGLEVIAISLDGDADDLQSFLGRRKLPWPVIHDNAESPEDRLQMKFGVLQLPTLLLLNKEGVVVSLEAHGAELDRLLDMLFQTPTLAPPPPAGAGSAAGDSASSKAK